MNHLSDVADDMKCHNCRQTGHKTRYILRPTMVISVLHSFSALAALGIPVHICVFFMVWCFQHVDSAFQHLLCLTEQKIIM